MRCKRHTVDFTSNVGICASCLRERLLSLAAYAAAEDNNNNHQSQKSNKKPPPLLIFPRSVSPYVTDVGGGDRRFLAAPQVDLGFSCKDFESNRSSKSKGGTKASRISNLFRARSEDYGSDRKPVSRNYGSDHKPVSRFSCDGLESSYSSSLSWLSSILHTGRSKKQPTAACYVEDVISGHRRPQRVFCRGMSPARDENEPPSELIEKTPAMKTPGRRKIVMGIGFCLSPLVRARPHCPFKRKTRFPSEVVGSAGEVTVLEKPHIAEAASFCANRSKKLVDLGRVHHRC
ncbi:hypothetical protein Bca4012_039985 [Brassica carinata]|uniref:Uncharacterized protein n=1 Tax=Brassica carinata TaxID=52824 RepID=A0A8X7W7K8_BRACI|nr:hypothetical protein Bca52824_008186 [Brassica carinata]